MNLFIIVITFINILACGGVLIFQLNLLSEIGFIYKRLGKNVNNIVSSQAKLETLMGLKTTLPSEMKAVFASLSCSSCYGVLKRLGTLDLNYNLRVFLVDQSTDNDARNAKSLFPELKFEFLAGEPYVGELNITEIPFYIEVNETSHVKDVLYLKNDPAVLNQLHK